MEKNIEYLIFQTKQLDKQYQKSFIYHNATM